MAGKRVQDMPSSASGFSKDASAGRLCSQDPKDVIDAVLSLIEEGGLLSGGTAAEKKKSHLEAPSNWELAQSRTECPPVTGNRTLGNPVRT